MIRSIRMAQSEVKCYKMKMDYSRGVTRRKKASEAGWGSEWRKSPRVRSIRRVRRTEGSQYFARTRAEMASVAYGSYQRGPTNNEHCIDQTDVVFWRARVSRKKSKAINHMSICGQ